MPSHRLIPSIQCHLIVYFKQQAPTSLSELTTAKIGERKCFKQSKMCLLVLLPGEGDADAEGDVETTLRALVSYAVEL